MWRCPDVFALLLTFSVPKKIMKKIFHLLEMPYKALQTREAKKNS